MRIEDYRDKVRRSCTDKIRHPSEATARRVAGQQSARRNVPMYVYHCPYCAGWHLTRTKPASTDSGEGERTSGPTRGTIGAPDAPKGGAVEDDDDPTRG